MVGLTSARVAGLAVLAVAGAAGLVHAVPAATAPVTPPVFAAVDMGANSGARAELRSVTTGAVLSTLGDLGPSWTNNGFAFSPDGRYVYFTLIPKSTRLSSLSLEQVAVATHQRRFIAFGEQPSVSPDGRLLAYVSGEDRSATIVVRDTASGRRRSTNLARLLGSQSDMLNASTAWLGDGAQLAVIEACCPIAVSKASAPAGPRSTRGSPGDQLHLIVVSVPRHGSLRARRVVLPGASQMPESVGADPTRPNALLVSWLIGHDRAAVDRLTIGASRATLARVLAIAHALVVAFDPSGRQLLYLLGHSPPALWTATVQDGQLSQRRLLIRDPPLDAYAW